jgi:hypothetical protein
VVEPAASVDSEVALFSGTTGKVLKRATGSGIVKLVSGVQSVVAALTQAESHGSPDTDSATSALHHTLGDGVNQARSGNSVDITLGPFVLNDVPGTATTQMLLAYMNTATAWSQRGRLIAPHCPRGRTRDWTLSDHGRAAHGGNGDSAADHRRRGHRLCRRSGRP